MRGENGSTKEETSHFDVAVEDIAVAKNDVLICIEERTWKLIWHGKKDCGNSMLEAFPAL